MISVQSVMSKQKGQMKSRTFKVTKASRIGKNSEKTASQMQTYGSNLCSCNPDQRKKISSKEILFEMKKNELLQVTINLHAPICFSALFGY